MTAMIDFSVAMLDALIPALPGTVACSAAANAKDVSQQRQRHADQQQGDFPRTKRYSKAGDLYADKQAPDGGKQGRERFQKLHIPHLTKTGSYQ